MQYPMMPETMVYNAGVERQFFDMAKEAIDSGKAKAKLEEIQKVSQKLAE